jgi:hypothetical protein
MVALLVVAGAGCGTGDGVAMGAQTTVVPKIRPLPIDAASSATTAPPTKKAAATLVRTPDGVALPDRKQTPGAAFPDVTAADICNDHYATGVRQPRFNSKVEAFDAYGISIHDRDAYQVDHLIPIELGGDNDSTNLWPQPHDPPHGSAEKDLLERQLRGLVCSMSIPLGEAQVAIAGNWWSAYQTYMGRPVAPGSEGPAPWTATPSPKPGEVVNGASCPTEGEVGYTDSKHVALTCRRTTTGVLQWQKRS